MNKKLGLLGLAKRAGRVVSGEDQVLEVIRKGKAKLVILSTDAGKNTAKRISDKCHSYQVPLMQFSVRGELGKAIGEEERVVVAVLDQGFADALRKT